MSLVLVCLFKHVINPHHLYFEGASRSSWSFGSQRLSEAPAANARQRHLHCEALLCACAIDKSRFKRNAVSASRQHDHAVSLYPFFYPCFLSSGFMCSRIFSPHPMNLCWRHGSRDAPRVLAHQVLRADPTGIGHMAIRGKSRHT